MAETPLALQNDYRGRGSDRLKTGVACGDYGCDAAAYRRT